MGLSMSKVEKLEKLCKEVRDIDNEFPPQTLQILCVVAQNPGTSIGDIGERVGLSFAATSRNIVKLCDKTNGKQGLGLLSVEFNPTNYSSKLITLTAKGLRFVERLADII
jgi:DNA-binding MarR family transcriptional regulator